MDNNKCCCHCDCDDGSSSSGTINGGVICSATLQGRIYAPTFLSAYQIAVDNGFEGTVEEWLDSLHGEDGKSAYEIAVDHGFVGTEEDWLSSLVGPPGSDGRSAYEVAVEHGFEGDEVDWLQSLKGEDGKSAYEIAVEHGFEGTEEEWIASISEGGTKDHQLLINRDAPDSHPIEAIGELPSTINNINIEISKKQDTILAASWNDVMNYCLEN